MGDILFGFQSETDWMPDLYTGAEMIAFSGDMIDRGWVTVAELDGRVVGFLARDGKEICALYLSPRINQRGIGRQLLVDAKSRSDGLRLWTFQHNEWAQRFYLRQGFVEVDRSDGARNDENLPDIAYVWTKETKDDPGPGPDRSGRQGGRGPGQRRGRAAGSRDERPGPDGPGDADSGEGGGP